MDRPGPGTGRAAPPPRDGAGQAAADMSARGAAAREMAAEMAAEASWRRRAWPVLALVLVLAAAAGAWWALRAPDGARYVTARVTRGDLTVVVTATGAVQPLNKVDVSSEQSGTVRRVHVDYNSTVVPGQVLAELDTDRLEANLRSAEARLAAAEAQLAVAEATAAEAEQEFARKQELAARQISPVRELDAAVAARRRAEANIAVARAQIAVAAADVRLGRINLERAVIRSPIRGVVLSRKVDPGQTVAVTLQAPVMFTIAEDLSQMELQVDVDEADVGRIKVGQAARFTVDAYPERVFPARIRDIRFGAEVVQGVVTYKAVLTIDNADLALRPGMTATAEIIAREVKGALLVPNAALRFTPPEPPKRSWLRSAMPGIPTFRPPSKPEETGPTRTLWRLEEGVPVAVSVRVGASDGRQSEIVDGAVKEGEAVIVDAHAR